jgi:ABC-type bacteriocin/lantibiotic exporter with double-glycine peptidase domain
MVLAGLGVEQTEAELRRLCDCTILGTDALKAVDAARALGFSLTCKENLSIAQSAQVLQAGLYPILYVNLLPINEEVGIHAMVAVSLDDHLIKVCDPLVGERQLITDRFEQAWQMTNGLAILISG